MTVPAVQRACELVELLKCGNVLDGIIDVLNYVPEPRTLEFQPGEINRILGSNLSEEEIIGYLKRL
jgi:phenylalanyl-tRNA synthetase beta chain